MEVKTYKHIPSKVMSIPAILCFEIEWSLRNQPRPTIVHVFKCPVTVLLTGPTASITANCDTLTRQAKKPL